MFGRKGVDGTDNEQENAATSENPAARVADAGQNLQRAPSPSPVQSTMARRVVDMAAGGRRASGPLGEERKLTVGKGLSLAGEITSCDILVVEGKVEAKLSDGKLLEITESGQFRGSVEIENADIAGRFDGQLVVHGRLTIRATGRISGMVKYGELEVSAGGQIIGELQVGSVGGQSASGTGGFKNAARHASLTDGEEAVVAKKSA